ncbi:MAG: S-adenosylmethionine:tRNA ribosyltransferase-isomerase, partial [uncultured Rubrobacteraceae bacterium]
ANLRTRLRPSRGPDRPASGRPPRLLAPDGPGRGQADDRPSRLPGPPCLPAPRGRPGPERDEGAAGAAGGPQAYRRQGRTALSARPRAGAGQHLGGARPPEQTPQTRPRPPRRRDGGAPRGRTRRRVLGRPRRRRYRAAGEEWPDAAAALHRGDPRGGGQVPDRLRQGGRVGRGPDRGLPLYGGRVGEVGDRGGRGRARNPARRNRDLPAGENAEAGRPRDARRALQRARRRGARDRERGTRPRGGDDRRQDARDVGQDGRAGRGVAAFRVSRLRVARGGRVADELSLAEVHAAGDGDELRGYGARARGLQGRRGRAVPLLLLRGRHADPQRRQKPI